MAKKQNVHFVGIGGIGMSGLARYFKAAGWMVSGSDIVETGITRALRKEGIKIAIGHRTANLPSDANLLIYNRAVIAGKNPEIKAAARHGVPAIPLARAIGALTERYTTVAVTGSHGKSTTTALAALTLIKGGFDPTVLIGTNLREFGGKNVRMGKSRYLVLEADDFGGAILAYSPAVAIVTNIDREHLDFYGTFGNLKKTFLGFLANVKDNGIFILNRDDKVLYGLRAHIAAMAKRKHAKVVWYSLRDPAVKKIKRAMALPGTHNLSNAAAAHALGQALGIPGSKTLSVLAAYRGAWRRMEYKGIARFGEIRAKIYDDYAHHPTEIKATLQAFRERYPRSPIVCVYQPHQAKRLFALFKKFVASFDEADVTILLPLYKVAGRDEIVVRDSAALVRAMHRRSPKQNVTYLADPKKIRTLLKKMLKGLPRSPVIVMMGAGDIADLTERLVARHA